MESSHEHSEHHHSKFRERRERAIMNISSGLKRSPVYLWEGLKYAFSHFYVWKSLIIPFLALMGASIVVFIILMIFLYPPQIKVIDKLVEDDDIVSEVYSFYLILQETKFLVNVIFMVVLDVVRRSIYDQMFEKEAPELKNYEKLSTVKTKDRLVIVGYSVAVTVTLDFITAPLLAIPIGGKILIAISKGWALAWSKYKKIGNNDFLNNLNLE